MPDIFTKRKRSKVMSRIRSAGNQATELQPSHEASDFAKASTEKTA